MKRALFLAGVAVAETLPKMKEARPEANQIRTVAACVRREVGWITLADAASYEENGS